MLWPYNVKGNHTYTLLHLTQVVLLPKFFSVNYLSVENVGKSFGERVLFKGVSFGLNEGQKTALVARNGSGKTSLLQILSGVLAPDEGQVTFRKGLRIEFLEQDPDLPVGLNVLDTVLSVDNEQTKAIQQYEFALENMDDTEAYQRAFERMDRLKAWDFEAQVKQILGKLGLEDVKAQTENLSGGQKKRVALARILISNPDLLIMDEPTNHLDIEMIEWLQEYINQYKLTLLMVTHDRYFLEAVCDAIIEMEDQKIYHHPGSYSKFLERKAERQEVEQVNLGKAKNLFKKELEWMRRQPQARGTKSKSRIDAFHDLKGEAHQRLDEDQVQLDIKTTRLGSKIIEMHRVRKSYGDLKILDGFDYVFKRGEKIGIVGPNGVGKSTFLNLVTDKEEPDGGKIITGETVKFGFYTQEGLITDEEKRVIEVVKDIAEFIPVGRKGRNITASQMCERFLFDGDQQYTYVHKLSGGERRRLYLLTVLMANPNFLILDEPTNDLDLLTLNVLEDFLDEFQGCVLMVSHDRYFMDRLVDHLFVFEGEGRVRDYPGNYTDYRDARTKEEETEKLRQQSMVKVKQTTAGSDSKEKTKLTYGERLEMEQLEKDLEALELKKTEIAKAFEEASTDADRIQELSMKMEEVNTALEEKEMRWLELSEYAE